MTGSLLGKMDECAAGSVHKMSRTTSAVAEAIENGIDTARRVGKRGENAAEDFMDDAVARFKRHPTESIVAAFAIGIALGGFIDYVIRRR